MAVEYNYRKRITALKVGRLVTVARYPESRIPRDLVYRIEEIIPRPDRWRVFVRLGPAAHLHPNGSEAADPFLQHQDNLDLVQTWDGGIV